VADGDDVARVCLALPGITEAVTRNGGRQWLVRDKTFVRERPPPEGAWRVPRRLVAEHRFDAT
jgi:hypothetical protein